MTEKLAAARIPVHSDAASSRPDLTARDIALGAVYDDALAAWAAYETTGEHATHEVVDAWLARLEAGEDADPPPCRP